MMRATLIRLLWKDYRNLSEIRVLEGKLRMH